MTRRVAFAALFAVGALLAAPAAFGAQERTVLRIDLDGAVDPFTASTVENGLKEAAERGDVAVLLTIDTPGGVDSAMRRIVRSVGASKVPVICWVGPAGSRAASAGAIIALGCPVTAMAPGTNIGAAHPVGFRGEVLGDKITNDAAAYARALAERWGRNGDVAERMVRDSLSLAASAALRDDIADLLADDIANLLEQVDSSTPREDPFQPPAGAGRFTFDTAGARVERFEMGFLSSLLHSAVDPNLAYVLLILGLLGIAVEILTPGLGVPGIAGTAALVVAAVILGMLPVNILGLGLIVAAVVLFIVEAHIPGGVAAVLGAAALLFGGLFLFDGSVPAARVSRALIIATTIIAVAFFVFVVRAVMKTRNQPPGSPTTEDLIGMDGVVERTLDPVGIVRARNEDWTAHSAAGTKIKEGVRVRIVAVNGLTLDVEPAPAPADPTPEVPAK